MFLYLVKVEGLVMHNFITLDFGNVVGKLLSLFLYFRNKRQTTNGGRKFTCDYLLNEASGDRRLGSHVPSFGESFKDDQNRIYYRNYNWDDFAKYMAEGRITRFWSTVELLSELKNNDPTAVITPGKSSHQANKGNLRNPVFQDDNRPEYTKTEEAHFVQVHVSAKNLPANIQRLIMTTHYSPKSWNQAIDRSIDKVQENYLKKATGQPSVNKESFVENYIKSVIKKIEEDKCSYENTKYDDIKKKQQGKSKAQHPSKPTNLKQTLKPTKPTKEKSLIQQKWYGKMDNRDLKSYLDKFQEMLDLLKKGQDVESLKKPPTHYTTPKWGLAGVLSIKDEQNFANRLKQYCKGIGTKSKFEI